MQKGISGVLGRKRSFQAVDEMDRDKGLVILGRGRIYRNISMALD